MDDYVYFTAPLRPGVCSSGSGALCYLTPHKHYPVEAEDMDGRAVRITDDEGDYLRINLSDTCGHLTYHASKDAQWVRVRKVPRVSEKKRGKPYRVLEL